MDDVGAPAHGAEIEGALFGSLPTSWLQEHAYPLAPGIFSWASALVHVSWFVVPWLVGLLVSLKRPERIGSLFLHWIALHFLANLLFAGFPLQPPWMASPDVTRIVALHLGSEVPDTNQLAAMPSLHVARPLLTSYWFYREQWRAPALAMLAYAALVSLEVVFSGEHYVIDVAGAVGIVAAIAVVGRTDRRRLWASLRWLFGGGNSAAGPRERPRPAAVRRLLNVGSQSPLTSRPGVIFAVMAVLIVVVVLKLALLVGSHGQGDASGGGVWEGETAEQPVAVHSIKLDVPISGWPAAGSPVGRVIRDGSSFTPVKTP
jgi:hypothetical protein